MVLKSEIKERQRMEALQYDVRTCSLVSGFGDRERGSEPGNSKSLWKLERAK